MHRIDTSTSVAGHFVDKDPGLGIPPTVVDAAWGNAVQDEIAHVIEQAGIALAKGTNTQLYLALQSILGPAPTPGKNALINPSFLVSQTGPGPFTHSAGSYTKLLDGWWFTRATGATVQAQIFPFAHAEAGVPGNPQVYLRWSSPVVGTGGVYRMASRMESVRTFQGSVVTTSGYFFNFNPTDGPVTLTPKIKRNYGTGGDPEEFFTGTAVVLNSSTWQFVTSTIALPTLLGKTIGANGDDYLEIHWDVAGTNDMDLGVANMQLEGGSIATTFDSADIQSTWLRCLRYRERSNFELPMTFPPGLEDPEPWERAFTTWGKGLLHSGTYYFPALSRRWLAPKRLAAVADAAQHSMRWYSTVNDTADQVDVDGTPFAVSATLGTTEFWSGAPGSTSNPGVSGVELRAHYAYEDLVI